MHVSGLHVHSMLLDSKGNRPLWLDVCTSADVVFGGENEFVVEHPLRFVVQDCRRVQLDHLVVFYSQVMTRALQMSHLKDNETTDQERGKGGTSGPTRDQLSVSLKELNHRHLHEEAGAERLADVDVVVSAGEFCAPTGQVEAVHDPGQLLPHVVRGH